MKEMRLPLQHSHFQTYSILWLLIIKIHLRKGTFRRPLDETDLNHAEYLWDILAVDSLRCFFLYLFYFIFFYYKPCDQIKLAFNARNRLSFCIHLSLKPDESLLPLPVCSGIHFLNGFISVLAFHLLYVVIPQYLVANLFNSNSTPSFSAFLKVTLQARLG